MGSFFVSSRLCEAQGGWCEPRNEAIPNYTGRSGRF